MMRAEFHIIFRSMLSMTPFSPAFFAISAFSISSLFSFIAHHFITGALDDGFLMLALSSE